MIHQRKAIKRWRRLCRTGETGRDACIKLDAWISAQVASGGEQDYVVLGDFNDEIDDPVQWNVFGPLLGKNAYVFLTEPEVLGGNHAYLPFKSFLDHVMVTSSTLVAYGDGATTVLALENDIEGDEVSDHRPVLSRFNNP